MCDIMTPKNNNLKKSVIYAYTKTTVLVRMYCVSIRNYPSYPPCLISNTRHTMLQHWSAVVRDLRITFNLHFFEYKLLSIDHFQMFELSRFKIWLK